jgi:conjugative transfer region protein TrbK
MATDQTRRSLATSAILFAALCVLSVVARGPRIVDDVVALSHDPQALQQALRDCRVRIAPAHDPACTAASEAWRRRFFGHANPPTSTTDAARPVRSQASQRAQPAPAAAPWESLSTVYSSRLIGP